MAQRDEDEPLQTPADRGATRLLLLLGVLIAGAFLVITFSQARQRISDAADADAVGRNTADLFITQPVDETLFVDNSIWTLPNERARFEVDAEGRPFVRLDSSTGVLVGSEGSDGLEGLALLPAGLPSPPSELFISSASTALAIVALHPDVSSADPETHRARLVAAIASPSFPVLADRVDGRPLATWGDDERLLLREVVDDSVLTRLSFPCADPEAVDSTISVCGGSTELLNASHRSVVVADAAGESCGIVPGAQSAIAVDGVASLRSLVGDGIIAAVDDVSATPGALLAACGDMPTVARDPGQLDLASRVVAFTDTGVPLARLLGATGAVSGPTDIDEALTLVLTGAEVAGPGSGPTAAAQFRLGVDMLRDPGALDTLGLRPLDDTTTGRLAELTALLERLYA